MLIVLSAAFFNVEAENGKMGNTLDSLQRALANAKNDSTRIAVYRQILSYVGDRDLAVRYAGELLELGTRINDTVAMLRAELGYVYAYINNHEIREAEKHLQSVVDLAVKSHDLHTLAKAYYLYAANADDNDDVAGMLNYGNQSLALYRQLNDTARIVDIYLMYAQSCADANMYKTAYEYLARAITLSHIAKNRNYTADVLVFYAATMMQQFDNEYYPVDVCLCKFQKIIKYCSVVYKTYQKSKLESYYHRQLTHLCHITKAQAFLRTAEILKSKAMADSCALYLQKANDILTDNKTLQYQTGFVEAGLHYYNGRYDKAVKVLQHMETIKVPHITPIVKLSCRLMAMSYEKLGNQAKALEYLDLSAMYDKLSNRIVASKRYADFKINLLSQAQIDLIETGKKRDIIQKDYDIKRQNYITVFIVILAAGVSLLTAIIIKSLARRRRINKELLLKNAEITKLNNSIIQQKKEIQERRDIITMQFDMVESFNESITTNIRYAGKIQRAAIPIDSEVRKIFYDSFVLFRPRDIVSGDFYTVMRKGVFSIFVVADCTGHGVPGALLSMLGISALNDILRHSPDDDSFSPSLVLDKMKAFIISAFEGKNGLDIYDGIDMAICALDTRNNNLHFAAANQSAFVWHNGTVLRLKGDKMPVGKYVKELPCFTEQTYQLEANDEVFMSTDGIQDQLGGPDGKKFLIRNLIVVLEKVGKMPTVRQKVEIETSIDMWRGKIPQIDDITVVGFRV